MPAVGSSLWIEGEVRRYLRTGDYDGFFAGWPGRTVIGVIVLFVQNLAVVSPRALSSKVSRLSVRPIKLDLANR
jgi:hypothetical protein